MTTFSPNYNTVLVCINETRHDSMTTKTVPNYARVERPLNRMTWVPFLGCAVGLCRTTTGTLDIITSIGKLVLGYEWLYQGLVGVENIFYGAVQAGPMTFAIVQIGLSAPFPIYLGIAAISIFFEKLVLLIYELSLSFFEQAILGRRPESNFPVAAYVHNSLAMHLIPRKSGFLGPEQWLDELYKYGTKNLDLV